MKRFLTIMLILGILLSLFSCGKSEEVNGGTYAKGSTTASVTTEAPRISEDTVVSEAGEAITSRETAATTTFAATAEATKAAIEAAEAAVAASKAAAEAAEASPGGVIVNNGGNRQPVAGLLTAGEWKDLDNLNFWKDLLLHNDWYALMERRSLYADKIAVVEVMDEHGHPCFNAHVELLDKSGALICTAVTDVTGRAFLTYDLKGKGNTPAQVRVTDIVVPFDKDVTRVTLQGDTGEIRALDLMLTVDTTGSMGDELEYLKTELENVIERVAAASKEVLSIRVSVNFYRDTGDVYVVQPFAFTDNVSTAIYNLQQQAASGGGDYPEAVHTALSNSVYEHQWREDAVKLLFLVLDAPPHSEHEISGIDQTLQKTVTDAAAAGIRIIPVASSGVDTETEFLSRSFAVMTGGTYIFLTNHSGIGGDHLEPTIGEYQVEALNDCLVRVIKEYCGLQ